MQSEEGTTHRIKICPLHHRHLVGFGMLTYIHYINRNFLDFFRQDWSLVGPSIFSKIAHPLLPSSLHTWLKKTSKLFSFLRYFSSIGYYLLGKSDLLPHYSKMVWIKNFLARKNANAISISHFVAICHHNCIVL